METKELPTCAQVAELLNIPIYQTLKTLAFTADYGKKEAHYIIMLLGDDDLNEVKLKKVLKAKNIYPAKPETLKELQLPAGYMSPLNRTGFSVLIDEAVDLNGS